MSEPRFRPSWAFLDPWGRFLGGIVLGGWMMLAAGSTTLASDPQELRKQASWDWPDPVKLRVAFEEWIDRGPDDDARRDARDAAASLSAKRGIALHEAVLDLASDRDSSINTFVDALRGTWGAETLSSLDAQLSSLIANGAIPNWIKPDLQLAYARALVHHQYVDEAMDHLSPLSIDSTSDPSSWLFALAVCQHHLLMKQPCEENLGKLLERETEIPSRFAITARLMLSDLEPLKEDSLDEIARMMNDVERRLALGRTGKQVRDQEQAIIDKLEKMIDQLEQQQQQQQQQQQRQRKGGSQKPQPMQGDPMQQSQPAGAQGQGEVDEKDIGDASGWGNLPPAQRQEALQSMTKDLPSHYREVIEAYFKRLANSPSRP